MRPVAPIIAIFVLALLGCSPAADSSQATPVGSSTADTPDPAAERIACAQGDVPLTDDCTIERAVDGTVTIRHPDGAFRRLNADGTAADGAQTAIVTAVDGAREVTVAGDRYRLPEPQR